MAKHLKNHQKNGDPHRSRSPGLGARMFYLPLFMLSLVISLSGMPREVRGDVTFDDAAMKKAFQPWKGDLNGMIERRLIRVLVTYNKTDFFLDGAANRGFTHEIFQKFDKFLHILDNSERGVWLIVPERKDISEVDPQHVVKTLREMIRKERDVRPASDDSEEENPEADESWRTKLHKILTQELSPNVFERLVKRLLHESGFVQVEVTGRTGDGGIDGKGIVKVGGLLSFHVLFQCKKYRDGRKCGSGCTMV